MSAVIVGCLASMAVSCGKEDIRDQMNPLDVEGPEGTLEINDWAMMTKEKVAQVIAYCDENKIGYKQRLEELGINPWSFYDAKRKYAPKEDGENAGERGIDKSNE